MSPSGRVVCTVVQQASWERCLCVLGWTVVEGSGQGRGCRVFCIMHRRVA